MGIFNIIKRYKSIVLYLIFGICTTVVNIIVYYICAHMAHLQTMSSTCIAWIFAVLFAYITNRIWVFESEANETKQIIKEIISFFSCRLATGIMDLIIMYIFVDIINMNDVIIKVLSNIAVIVLNYVASKLVIFKKN